jgi:hypothetical protein
VPLPHGSDQSERERLLEAERLMQAELRRLAERPSWLSIAHLIRFQQVVFAGILESHHMHATADAVIVDPLCSKRTSGSTLSLSGCWFSTTTRIRLRGFSIGDTTRRFVSGDGALIRVGNLPHCYPLPR